MSDAFQALQISDDMGTKPAVPAPTGTPPSELQSDDVVVGEGTAAKPGDHVHVHYVGVSFSDGKQFDSSWEDRKSTRLNSSHIQKSRMPSSA